MLCQNLPAEANKCSWFDDCCLGNTITRPPPLGKDYMPKYQNVSRKGQMHTEVERHVYFGKAEANADAQHGFQSMIHCVCMALMLMRNECWFCLCVRLGSLVPRLTLAFERKEMIWSTARDGLHVAW